MQILDTCHVLAFLELEKKSQTNELSYLLNIIGNRG